MCTHLTFQIVQSNAQHGLHLVRQLTYSFCVTFIFLISLSVFVYMYICLMILIVFA